MWNCTRCSEPNEDSFDGCWKCGTGKDGAPPPAGFTERALTHDEAGAAEGKESGESPPSGKTDYLRTGINIIVIFASLAFFGAGSYGIEFGTLFGALAGGAVAGALCGLLPFFLLRKRSSRFAMAAIGFCATAGMVLGLVAAVPVAIVLTGLGYLVLPKKTPPALPSAPAPRCSYCGCPYQPEDYDPAAEHIYCARCQSELPRQADDAAAVAKRPG